jgi:hypothetical protein
MSAPQSLRPAIRLLQLPHPSLSKRRRSETSIARRSVRHATLQSTILSVGAQLARISQAPVAQLAQATAFATPIEPDRPRRPVGVLFPDVMMPHLTRPYSVLRDLLTLAGLQR